MSGHIAHQYGDAYQRLQEVMERFNQDMPSEQALEEIHEIVQSSLQSLQDSLNEAQRLQQEFEASCYGLPPNKAWGLILGTIASTSLAGVGGALNFVTQTLWVRVLGIVVTAIGTVSTIAIGVFQIMASNKSAAVENVNELDKGFVERAQKFQELVEQLRAIRDLGDEIEGQRQSGAHEKYQALHDSIIKCFDGWDEFLPGEFSDNAYSAVVSFCLDHLPEHHEFKKKMRKWAPYLEEGKMNEIVPIPEEDVLKIKRKITKEINKQFGESPRGDRIKFIATDRARIDFEKKTVVPRTSSLRQSSIDLRKTGEIPKPHSPQRGGSVSSD